MSKEQYEILRFIQPQLRQDGEKMRVALGVLEGPYKGVVFFVNKFAATDQPAPEGMMAVRFETKILEHPAGFHPDESWDAFCCDVIVAWFAYVADNDFEGFMSMPVKDSVH